jgi:uncharacterized protein (TIGR03435 family)
LAHGLDYSRKLLLTAISIAVGGGPVVISILSARQICAQSPLTTAAPSPSFEVAAIRPNRSGDHSSHIRTSNGRFGVTNQTTKTLIEFAYNIQDIQISGGPSWIASEKYDIDAKIEDSLAEELQKLPPEKRREQLGLMLQSLLADRFNLKVGHETRELPVYALILAKNGPKLQESKPSDTSPNGTKGSAGHVNRHMGISSRAGESEIRDEGATMAAVAQQLSQQLSRTVLDQTGLKGMYDFTLRFSHDQSPPAMFKGSGDSSPGTGNAPPPESSVPSIFTAIQEQLGLKLEPTKGPVEILVIGHIEKPSEN